MALRSVLTTVLNAVEAIVAFFLVLRIVFRFFGASPASPFVAWVYEVSARLLSPFSGFFANTGLLNLRLDIVAIFGLAIYFIIVYLLWSLIHHTVISARWHRHA